MSNKGFSQVLGFGTMITVAFVLDKSEPDVSCVGF